MTRSPLAAFCVPLAAFILSSCMPAPVPVAATKPAAPDPRLQPILQPPPQVLVAPAPPEKEDFNKLLAQRVKKALEAESKLHAEAIDVTAMGGTVTLWGTASTDDERARATRVATRVSGVNWVNNRLVIGSGS